MTQDALTTPSSRSCAICRKTTGSLTGMRRALQNLGIKGGYAHHRCYDKARGVKNVSQR
jgi:inhibitor of KinA sporulation pathway (predicted exonuclease)